ncbi:MAG: precorrin-2 dehydrogenase/sirohydrochlorin ferrochelatase family protein [Terriglobales bacterium]
MELFPIFVKLARRRCVVIGAGEIGAAKIAGLLACDANITVVAPEATGMVRAAADAGKLTWHARAFAPADLEGMFLAVAATGSPETNHRIYSEANQRGVLCNVVDDPDHCDFFYPAIVRRGALQIAISTGGLSPALARRLRQELEAEFGPEYEAWVEEVGQARRQILDRDLPDEERQRQLNEIASRKAFEAFVRKTRG